jgi:hypothetical protein
MGDESIHGFDEETWNKRIISKTYEQMGVIILKWIFKK